MRRGEYLGSVGVQCCRMLIVPFERGGDQPIAEALYEAHVGLGRHSGPIAIEGGRGGSGRRQGTKSRALLSPLGRCYLLIRKEEIGDKARCSLNVYSLHRRCTASSLALIILVLLPLPALLLTLILVDLQHLSLITELIAKPILLLDRILILITSIFTRAIADLDTFDT